MARSLITEFPLNREMPSLYDHFDLRVEVCGPVAAESPFDSGTLWGRVIHALSIGDPAERELALQWLDELAAHTSPPSPPVTPPLLVSEGFPCDRAGEPWLPLPLATYLALQQMSDSERRFSRKDLKRIDRVPKMLFVRVCNGEKPNPAELKALLSAAGKPKIVSDLAPHLGMDRLTGTGREGLLYMTEVSLYQNGDSAQEDVANTQSQAAPEIVFYLKLRQKDNACDLVKKALQRICVQGWGHGTARGLGHVKFKSFDPSTPPPKTPDANGFVSLSHFTPGREDPPEGLWKLKPKHPVPTQFLDGRKIALGEEDNWRVSSFLRLVAGSCLFFNKSGPIKEFYGSTLSGLLDPAVDHEGNPLPPLFHYALSYPWPLKII